MIQFIFEQNGKITTEAFNEDFLPYFGLVKTKAPKYLIRLAKNVEVKYFDYVIGLIKCRFIGDFDEKDLALPFMENKDGIKIGQFKRKNIWEYVGKKTWKLLKKINDPVKVVGILNLACALHISPVIDIVSLWTAITFIDGKSKHEIKRMFNVEKSGGTMVRLREEENRFKYLERRLSSLENGK